MYRLLPCLYHLSILLISINMLLDGAFSAAFRPPHQGEPLRHWQSPAFRHWDASRCCKGWKRWASCPCEHGNVDFFENLKHEPCHSPAAARISNRMPQVGFTHKQQTQKIPLFFSRGGLCGAWHAEPKRAELGMVKESLWRIVLPWGNSNLFTAVCGP